MHSFPRIPLLAQLPWLRNVSVWSAPLELQAKTKQEERRQHADTIDSFLLGGGGLISARLGVRDRLSTMERIMAPYLSSYNFAENVNFRMCGVTPSRDFYPPFTFTPIDRHIWRVRNTAVIITCERDTSYELTTVSAVHPELQIILRYAVLKNISKEPINDIGISFDAPVDIPYPIAGHRSVIMPLTESRLSERVQEMQPIGRDYSPEYSNETQRYRYAVRGVIGAKNRGYEDLFVHQNTLAPDATLEAVFYFAPALDNTEQGAIRQADRAEEAIATRGISGLFQEIERWWQERKIERAEFTASEQIFTELIENNAILQTTVERATGGFVVIDDYTGSWLRDHNGSHLLSLELGLHQNVRRSMDRYYGLDVSAQSLYSYYASDTEPASPLPAEPDWSTVPGFITGDVPNFRTLWYWWYFKHTGDLEFVRDRFNYMKGAFLRQKLHESNYLATYCFDETYGIGPIGPMRTGLSCDNSFNALSAARKLATFAKLLGRSDADELEEYAAAISKSIEETFWLEKEGYYAMRVTPDGKLDKTALSVGLLRPTWVGSNTEATEDHAIRSAVYVLKSLYHKNGFLRLIDGHDQTVTMMIGYLLYAMKKIGHPEIDRVLYDVLKWADPSGTFGEYLDEEKDGPHQCYEHMAHRNRMWESGINTHAVLQALIGFEPDAYNRKATLSPYLPAKWKNLSFSRMRVSEDHLSIEMQRTPSRTQYVITSDAVEPLALELRLGHLAKKPGSVKINKHKVDILKENIQTNRFKLHTLTLRESIDRTQPLIVEVGQ